MLVGFPIALFAATIGLELAYIGTQDVFYFRAAMVANIAGVIAALAAVIHVGIEPAVRARVPSEPDLSDLDEMLADLDRQPAPRVYATRRPAAITIH